MTSLSAQDISAHRWQDRVLILLTDEQPSALVEEQVAIFQKEEEGLRERRLVVYRISPTTWRKGLSSSAEARVTGSSNLYQRFNPDKKSFQLVLIGLDGGTKWRVDEVVSCADIFALIDGMPMRRAEMRRKSGG